MKKLLGVLLAIAMSWPVSAAVLSNVEVVGEIQTIASDVDHNKAAATVPPAANFRYNNGVSNRVLAGLSADLVEDVTANLLFQYADVWGDSDNTGKSVQNYWNQIRLVNANVTLHNLFCSFDVTVGRQFYGDEDSAVMYIGPNHYNAEANGYVNSVDAAKLVYADDVKAFTMIAGTIEDRNAWLPAADRKYNLFGADFKLHLTDGLFAQVYGYDMTAKGTAVPVPAGLDEADKHSGFYGAKVGMNGEAVRASAEYARNFGGKRLIKEHKDTGYMVKADLAADINALTARGTFLYAKQGFEAMGNYTPGLLVGHLLGGNGIWDYSNEGVRLFNLGFDMKAAEKWVFALDGYLFQARTGHASSYEADLTAKYNHNEYVQLFAGIGYARYAKTENYTGFDRVNMDGKDNVKGQLGMLIKF